MGNYAKICVSPEMKKLFNTIARKKFLEHKPEFENYKVTENMIFESMFKVYTGYISLKNLGKDGTDKI